MGFIDTPNMNLPVPVVGQEDGPQYAIDVNSCFTLLDQHDHTPGKGVAITPSAMNINAALTFNNNFATSVAGIKFNAQVSTPGLSTIYESGVDLFYVDGNGNNVRITQSGSVAGTPGSISGLVSPASATYVPGTSTFVWQSNTNIAANMDFGAAILRNLSPNSTFALTLQPPAALSSNYSITLPTLPAQPNTFVTIDTSGNMSAVTTVDNVTIGLSGNQIQVKTGGITANQLGNISNSQTITSSGTFTVPPNVGLINILACGGGGGGGGGGAGSGTGGAGGNGSVPVSVQRAVTPGEVLTITIGAGGTGGVGGFGTGSPANGTNGSAGGQSKVVNGSSVTLIQVNGGLGGALGPFNNTGSTVNGGAAGISSFTGNSFQAGGGAGGGTGPNFSGTGANGTDSLFALGGTGALGGSTSFVLGGGAGGGAGFLAGANGGSAVTNFSLPSNPGAAAAANSGAGGGGGGGSHDAATGFQNGGSGGNGGSGVVVISWLGHS